MTTKKKDLCKKARDRSGLTLPVVQKAVNAFLYELNHAVIRGERVEIRNWGVWSVKKDIKRMVRNFQTNEMEFRGLCREIRFRPAQKFKMLVKKGGK